MKRIIIVISLLAFGIGTVSAQCQKKCAGSCGAMKAKTSCTTASEKAEVKAYYFHATRRCATCQAVEDVTKKTI